MSENVTHRNLLREIEQERSEEVKDILDRVPASFSTAIIVFLFFIFGVLVILGFVINYPDVITGQATLNASRPAVKVVMPSSGKLMLDGLKQKKLVKEGDLLAVVENGAFVTDVQVAKQLVNSFNPFSASFSCSTSINVPETLKLGEINVPYYQFRNALIAYQNACDNDAHQQQINQAILSLQEQRESLRQARRIMKTLDQTLSISHLSLQRDSVLFASGAISQEQLEKRLERFLQVKHSHQIGEADVMKSKASITALIGKADQLRIEQDKHFIELKMSIVNAYTNLVASIENWERKYAMIAPISGRVEFLQFWSNNQYVYSDTEVFSVIPDDNPSKVEVILPSDGVGKVKKGQTVYVKLEDYPSREFGYLEGAVSDIFLTKLNTKEGNVTLVHVHLTNGNITNYGIKVALKHGMNSTIEIITEEKRLIHRLFERIKYIL